MEIELPDGTVLEAPDDADPSAVARAYLSKQSKSATPAKSSPLQNFLGYQIEPAMQMATGAVATPLAGLSGIAGSLIPGEQGQGARWTENVQNALTYQPRTAGGKLGSRIVNYPFEKLAQGADYLGGGAANLTGSPAVGAAVNTTVQSLPALLLKGRGKPVVVRDNVPGTTTVGDGVARRPGAAETPAATAAERTTGLENVRQPVPTIEQLSADASAAYKRAQDAGVVVSEESFGGFKKKVTDSLAEEGLDSSLHPDTTAALKRVSETEGAVSLQQLETLRKIANDARGSVKPADSRLASKIVDDIDDFVDGLGTKDVLSGDPKAASALAEARNLYSRKKKAEEIEQLIHRAELSAPNFSASGMENALRTEFRALAKNEKRMRRFTKEERAAIEKVAKGGATENALRMLGKFAPTGAVSGVLSSGAGFLAGGPLGAAGLPAAGLIGRYLATRMTKSNAQAAQELMRAGPRPLPPPMVQPSLLGTVDESRGIF